MQMAIDPTQKDMLQLAAIGKVSETVPISRKLSEIFNFTGKYTFFFFLLQRNIVLYGLGLSIIHSYILKFADIQIGTLTQLFGSVQMSNSVSGKCKMRLISRQL